MAQSVHVKWHERENSPRSGLLLWRGMASQRASWAAVLLAAILVVEAILCTAQAYFEPTYAFDWDAYMEQTARFAGFPTASTPQGVATFNLNYSQLSGDTGALVYPAAHVYVHTALNVASRWDAVHWTTEYSPKAIAGYDTRTLRPHTTIRAIQVVYLIAFLALVSAGWRALGDAPVARPEAALAAAIVFVLSRRARSVAVLGLFNEAWVVLASYTAVALFARRHWFVGCIVYAVAVNTKMSALLYAPGLLAVLLHAGGAAFAARHIALCAAVCFVLGAPFLWHAPREYISAAFNLGRAFEQRWSVNWAFLPPSAFSSRAFAAALLATHLAALLTAYVLVWRPVLLAAGLGSSRPPSQLRPAPQTRRSRGSSSFSVDMGMDYPGAPAVAASATQHPLRRRHQQQAVVAAPEVGSRFTAAISEHVPSAPSQATAISLVLLSANLIGICTARSLHFQFHLWLWHSLPALLAWILPIPNLPPQWSPTQWRACLPVVAAGAAHVAYAVALEVAWNVHPPTPASSAAVTALHWLLLTAVLWKGWALRRQELMRLRGPHASLFGGTGHGQVVTGRVL
jgi:alpha-1,3-mannosyltransferase